MPKNSQHNIKIFSRTKSNIPLMKTTGKQNTCEMMKAPMAVVVIVETKRPKVTPTAISNKTIRDTSKKMFDVSTGVSTKFRYTMYMTNCIRPKKNPSIRCDRMKCAGNRIHSE